MDRPDYEAMERIINRLPETESERRVVKHLVIRDPNCGVTDEWVAPEMVFCRNLESVVLSGVADTSDKTIVQLARENQNIQGLDLTGCRYVSDVGILELVSQAPPLQWLQLSGVVLTDPTVSAIAKSFSRLVELELSDEPLLTALSVRDIWAYSRKLHTLMLARCPLLTDKAFPSPIKKGSKPSKGPDKPLPHRPLTWLDELPPLILRHTAVDLRVLDLSYCTKLTDDGIEGVIVHAPSLHTLSLAGCTNLTDRTVVNICKLGVQLGTLTLAHVSQITDGAIVQLARSCLQLRSLDLAFCRLLTDMSVFELAALRHLHRLVLVRVPKLTDNAIYFLGDHARSLERLHLSYCDRISLKALHHLLRHTPKLDHLTATGVPAARRTGLRRFSDPPPGTMDPDQKSVFRVFSGKNVAALRKFLDKEKLRRQQAEAQNIPFIARCDDEMDLY
ncbi:RNI-like protein [Paxillus ammoniavirescens]|nr:RNI-like protein [Paxillus ammoniavirescens]